MFKMPRYRKTDSVRDYTRGMSESIRDFKFDGGRYTRGAGMPLDSIDELRRLQTLLSSVARELFLEDHPGRERVSKKFRESILLRLVALEPGSVATVMTRPHGGDLSLDVPDTSYFQRSLEILAESVESLEADEVLPVVFPAASIPDFLQLGRSFRNTEALKLRRAEEWVAYGRKSRKVLQRIASVSEIESEVTLLGQVRGLNSEPSATFAFQRSGNGTLLTGKFEESLWDALHHFLGQDDRAPLVSISAVVSQDTDGRPQSIVELQSIELALPLDWSQRVQELANLEAGWLDGIGGQVLEPTVETLEEVLIAAFDAGLERPGIFPTPSGELRLEWEFQTGGAIVETAANTGFRSVLLTDRGDEIELTTEDPAEIVERISAEFPHG